MRATTPGSAIPLEEALRFVYAAPTGRVAVRGGNGTGKSTLLAALKAEIKNRAYYWPTTDRLAFDFAAAAKLDEPADEEPETGEFADRGVSRRGTRAPG